MYEIVYEIVYELKRKSMRMRVGWLDGWLGQSKIANACLALLPLFSFSFSFNQILQLEFGNLTYLNQTYFFLNPLEFVGISD